MSSVKYTSSFDIQFPSYDDIQKARMEQIALGAPSLKKVTSDRRLPIIDLICDYLDLRALTLNELEAAFQKIALPKELSTEIEKINKWIVPRLKRFSCLGSFHQSFQRKWAKSTLNDNQEAHGVHDAFLLHALKKKDPSMHFQLTEIGSTNFHRMVLNPDDGSVIIDTELVGSFPTKKTLFQVEHDFDLERQIRERGAQMILDRIAEDPTFFEKIRKKVKIAFYNLTRTAKNSLSGFSKKAGGVLRLKVTGFLRRWKPIQNVPSFLRTYGHKSDDF